MNKNNLHFVASGGYIAQDKSYTELVNRLDNST